jgi:Spy/CpxP family protein refolding chaperone
MITLAAVGLVGVAPGTAAAAQEHAAVAEPAADAPTPHGFAQMVGEALAEVTLNADQEADVEALGNTVEPLQREVDKAEAGILSALAEQVKEGKIDRAALEPEISRYITARVQIAGPIRNSLEALHEILDENQRADFTDALECTVHDVTRNYLSAERLDAFAKKLGLDEQQMKDVKEEFAELVPMIRSERNDVHAAIEAFRGDTFALDRYFPRGEVAARAAKRAVRIVDATEALVRILNPEQVMKLAKAIDEAARVQEERATAPSKEMKGEEEVGTAQQPWRAGFVRGGWYGGRWARPLPVYRPWGAGVWYGRRVAAYPVVAGWGWGW